MEKADRTVVRNEAHRRTEVGNMNDHNERKNLNYGNVDILTEQSHLNVHFKQCDGTYLEAFDKLLADGKISVHGIKDNAKIIDEFIFDVNSTYFENNGGYEYAKTFFEEAYKMAVNEAGGDDYILSAVMHADEKNKKLSEQLGRVVYHYHLHIVYVPVVKKELKWSTRCKDKALVGTVKEVINQVSNSKKWASEMVTNENGKPVLQKSYSLLQDRFFEHMQAAGYNDIERGEKGSTMEHLDVLDYKIQQDTKTVNALNEAISEKENKAATIDKAVSKKEKQVSALDEKLAFKKKADKSIQEIENMASKTFTGNMQLTPKDWATVLSLAKEGVTSREDIEEYKKLLSEARKSIKSYQAKQGTMTDYMNIFQETQAYRDAKKLYPVEVNRFIADILKHGQAEKVLEQATHHGGRNRGDAR